MKYYYGQQDQEVYVEDDPYQAAIDICDDLWIEECEIYEMKVSRHEEAWCQEHLQFIEKGIFGDCGMDCKEYDPQNGKWGKCIHQSWGLMHTGRILLISKDGELIKKIAPRRKI